MFLAMWHGRFSEDTAEQLKQFSESISFDWRLYPYDIEGSIAHAQALADARLITADECALIEQGLRDISRDIETGAFQFNPNLEDIHMNIEAALTLRVGEAGAKLHTARSRNDQVALDLRLYLRAEIRSIQNCLAGLSSGRLSIWPLAIRPLLSRDTLTFNALSPCSSRIISLLTWRCWKGILQGSRTLGNAPTSCPSVPGRLPGQPSIWIAQPLQPGSDLQASARIAWMP